MINTQKV